MHGNVWEWCEDQYDAKEGPERVFRGGSFVDPAGICRAANRDRRRRRTRPTNVGFRLARVPSKNFTNSLGMEFALVPKGKSWLGGGNDKEGTKEVDIPQDFYLGVYEVTQEEWQNVMGKDRNPSHFSRTGEGKDS